MSIWKRGVNLVKGAISEASKSADPEKMRALDEEMKISRRSKENSKITEGNDLSVKKSEETSEDNPQELPTIDSDKTLESKKENYLKCLIRLNVLMNDLV